MTTAGSELNTRVSGSLGIWGASIAAFTVGCLAAAFPSLWGKEGDFFLPERVSALTVIVCLIGLVALVVALPASGLRAPVAGALALAVGSTVLVMPWIAERFHFLPLVDQAVGAAVFRGKSYRQNYLALAGALLVVLGIGLAAIGWLRRRSEESPPSSASVARLRPPWSRRARVASLGLVALGAVTMLPDINALMNFAQGGVFGPAWDSDNLFTWRAFTAAGFRPMVDFFYPYGFQHVFTTTLLEGPLLLFAYQLALLALLGRAVYVISGRRFGPPIVIVGLIALLGSPVVAPISSGYAQFSIGVGSAVVGDVWRYLLPVVVALLFAAIDLKARRLTLDALLFGAATVVALFLDPSLVLYAASGAFAVLVVDIATCGRGWWSELQAIARGFALALILPVAGAVGWFTIMQVTGAWSATREFVLSPTTISNYTALPTIVSNSLSQPFTADFVLIVAPSVAVILALVLAWSSIPRLRSAARFSAVVGAVTVTVLLKDLVRPAATSLLFLPLLLVVGVVALVPLRSDLRDIPARAALAGLVVALSIMGGVLPDIATATRLLPSRVVRDAKVVLRGSRDIAAAERARFSPERYVYHPEQALVRTIKPQLHGGRVFALGDAQSLYAMLGQRPYFTTTVYESSPIETQRRVVRALREDPPQLVVALPSSDEFGVPQVVRAPLIYEWIIDRYRPESRVGSYSVLVPRDASDRVPWAFWARSLGRSINLGGIPAAANLPPTGCKRDCTEYLRVRLRDDPTDKRPVAVPVRVGDRNFSIRFITVPGHRDYVVRLDRVWFWALGREAHEPIQVGRIRGVEGAEQTVVRSDPSDALY